MDTAYAEQVPLEPSSPPSWRGLKDVAFGSVRLSRLSIALILNFFGSKAAGMVSKVFEHPFDLCKVRLQSQVMDQTARFNGPIDCLRQTWQKEGLRGLYRVR
jgi:ornithine carrier protein